MSTQLHRNDDKELQVRQKQQVQGETGTHEGPYFEPAVDIYETDDALVVTADIPGVKLEDIQTDLHDSQLTLSARRRPIEGRWRPAYTEYAEGHFLRTFRLGQAIDQTKITAQYKDGVLTLTLPKQDRAKPRKIQIQAK